MTDVKIWLPVPAGELLMGSSMQEVERCVEYWSSRLIDASYVADFRSWIMKEYPEHHQPIRAFLAWKYPVTSRQADK